MGDEQGGSSGKSEPKKSPGLWDRWPGKIGVPLLTCVLGVLLKDGCDRHNRQTQALDYYVVSTPSLIQRPNLGDKPLSVTVDGRPVSNLSTATLYLVNRSREDYENVPVEVSFSTSDGSPVELVRESVWPDRVSPTTAPTTVPAGRVTRRYVLGVANRQRANDTVLTVEYVFASEKVPNIGVYVEKKGLVAEQQQLLRKEDVERWTVWATAIVSFLCGLAFIPAAKLGDRLADRTIARLKPGTRVEKSATEAAD